MTALFVLAIFVALGFHVRQDQQGAGAGRGPGRSVRADQGAAIRQLDYLNSYGEELDKGFTSIPRPSCGLSSTAVRPNQGIAGVILKPWNERTRSAQKIKPILQQKVSAVEGMNAFVFSLPPLPPSIGGLPVQMVIDSTGDFVSIYDAMEKIKTAARQSGLFMVIDSDLAFNQPTIEVQIDRNKANDLGITMAAIGDRWHC